MFYLFYGFIWLITWLPLRVLYILSDFAYLIIYYVAGYRKDVVRKNLENSFPLKTSKERRLIERRFYRYFCDIFLETLYEMHCSEEEIRRRMNIINVELILDQYAKGKSCLVMTAHYGNWEWASAFSLSLPKENPLYGIYKKQRNSNFDALMCGLRMKFTGKTVERHDLLRKMVQLRSEGKLAVFGMISDQTPNGRNIHYWTNFLNQDTPVLLGTEQLAKKFDYPVFYFHIDRVKRGYYTCEFVPIAPESKLTAEYEITETYMRILEKKIEAAPEFWLWTHKRWKYHRERV